MDGDALNESRIFDMEHESTSYLRAFARQFCQQIPELADNPANAHDLEKALLAIWQILARVRREQSG